MKDREGTGTSIRTMVNVTTDRDQHQDMVNVQVITDRDEAEYRSMGERRTAPSVRGKGGSPRPALQ